jgi:hypothetical protein
MKKTLVLTMVLALAPMLAGCGGAQKNSLDYGHALVKQGDCAAAAPYLEDTVAQPDSLMDLALGYFLKGVCAEKSGDNVLAYQNFYAAKIVACYSVAHDTHTNLNTYGRSEYCQERIPKKLEELASKINDAAKIESTTDKVDKLLTARYMERFNKRLN